MHITDTLLETARADSDLLIKNDKLGDDLSKAREVTFLLIAPSKKKAELVASFVDDNRYGAARVKRSGAQYGIYVAINMPIEQNVLASVSGFMACLAEIFGIKYDGWESDVQRVA